MAKTEREMLIDQMEHFPQSYDDFNPEGYINLSKRLNRINLLRYLFNTCPLTMDPDKITDHWSKSYNVIVGLKLDRWQLEKISSLNERMFAKRVAVQNINSYKKMFGQVVSLVLKEENNE